MSEGELRDLLRYMISEEPMVAYQGDGNWGSATGGLAQFRSQAVLRGIRGRWIASVKAALDAHRITPIGTIARLVPLDRLSVRLILDTNVLAPQNFVRALDEDSRRETEVWIDSRIEGVSYPTPGWIQSQFWRPLSSEYAKRTEET